MPKKALITGITGQDGSYLAEFLIEKGYEVHGIRRRSSQFNTSRIDHILLDRHQKSNLKLHYGDMTDSSSLSNLITNFKYDEIYHLAAQSHVAVSFEVPEYTTQADAVGCLRILEAIRLSKNKKIKFYNASTSEMYGNSPDRPYNEKSRMIPNSPYACAKLYAHNLVDNYRSAYDMFLCNGILFNHESPRRGENFISRKVTIAFAKLYYGLIDKFYIGNLNSKRDWGHAKDYVRAMHKIINHQKPDNFVIATGETFSVKDLINECASILDIDIKWDIDKNKLPFAYSNNVAGKIKKNQKIIITDPLYFRPSEVDNLVADISKAKKELKWTPKIKFKDLLNEMIMFDLEKFKYK